MKVKIGDKIYDAEKEPIMLILTDQDKNNINNMPDCCSKFIIYPSEWDKKQI